jgi:hypothetical protein
VVRSDAPPLSPAVPPSPYTVIVGAKIVVTTVRTIAATAVTTAACGAAARPSATSGRVPLRDG